MSASHERDRRVEQLLRQWRRTPRHTAPGACLDAETVAAWVDGGLSGQALEMARSHAADCARCQALLGTLTHTGSALPQPAPSPRRWLAWALPLTAGATAVALWIAVPRHRDAPAAPPPRPQEQAADVPAPAPPSLDKPKVGAPPTGKEERRDQATREGLRADAPRRETEIDRLGAAQEATGRITPAAPGGAPALSKEAQAAPQEAAIDSRNRADAASPPPDAPAARSSAALAPGATTAILVISPDPSARWRLVGPLVEHSTDGGSSWEVVLDGAPAVLTSGAAPSPSVCWVVGRGGVVLRSTDGHRFSRVAFPEAIDLSAVRATDVRTASVTSVDGRVFRTTDGGASWF